MARRKRRKRALIQAYGLFWRRDEINWNPGTGNRYDFRLYGRRGSNRANVLVADFSGQFGIYILYGNYGPHYVGLTRRKGLAKRLKDHVSDKHGPHWDRFSWFGFRSVLRSRAPDGTRRLRKMAGTKPANLADMIADFEALLIRSMALKNTNRMKFAVAKEWTQVKLDEWKKYAERL
jgi:hypothetical protein